MNGVHRDTCGPYSPRLIGAVQRDDPEYLQEVLDDNRKMIGLDDLTKALILSADKGAEDCTRILLAAGALPNSHDGLGYNPVIVASKKGNAKVLKILAEAGANVSRASPRIRATGLHWAASQGHYDCVKVLLDFNAKLEVRTGFGRTPLMQAARSGFHEIVSYLISCGAEVNAIDYERCTALHLAAEEGNMLSMRTLIKAGADVDSEMRNGDTPIMKAAMRGQREPMILLINRGCNLKVCGRQMTPLHWAAEGGHTDCLGILLRAGMDPNICTSNSYHGADFSVHSLMTPLMLAARKANVKAIQYLVEAGVDVNAVDSDGYTALLYAVRTNNRDAILALLRGGADIDGVPSDSPDASTLASTLSPLFYSIREDFIGSLRTLLRANCSLHVTAMLKDGCHVGPLEYALSRERIKSARMLIDAGIGQFVINPEELEVGLIWLLGEDETLGEWFMETLKAVPTLLQLARLAVRANLGRPLLPESVNKLPIPPRLLEFVDLQELNDM